MRGVLLYLELDAPDSASWNDVADTAVGILGCEATPNYKIDGGSVRAYEALSDVEDDIRSKQILTPLAPPMRPWGTELQELGYAAGDNLRAACPLCHSDECLIEVHTYIGDAHADAFELYEGQIRGSNYPDGTHLEWDSGEPLHGREWRCGICGEPFRAPKVLPKVPVEPPKEFYGAWVLQHQNEIARMDWLMVYLERHIGDVPRLDVLPNFRGFLVRVPGSRYFRDPPARPGTAVTADLPSDLEMCRALENLQSLRRKAHG